MLGLDTLDVAIGFSLLFLLVSLLCTAVREGVESVLKMRAMDLERGLRELLDDRDGSKITSTLFAHPLIASLFQGEYDPAKLTSPKSNAAAGGQAAGALLMPLAGRRHLPSYIPAASFAGALLDIVGRGAVSSTSSPSLAPPTVADLRAAVLTLPSLRLQRAVLIALDQAGEDVELAKRAVENWYDATMDRVSGWYKRRTKWILFGIGLALAVVLNIDAIAIGQRLVQDPVLRRGAVAAADSALTAPTAGNGGAQGADPSFEALVARVNKIGFPIGWSDPRPQACFRSNAACTSSSLVGTIVLMVLGWLVTAVATTLGAPFWFDVLSRIMIVRSTIKPRQKSPEDPSIEGPSAMPAAAAAARDISNQVLDGTAAGAEQTAAPGIASRQPISGQGKDATQPPPLEWVSGAYQNNSREGVL